VKKNIKKVMLIFKKIIGILKEQKQILNNTLYIYIIREAKDSTLEYSDNTTSREFFVIDSLEEYLAIIKENNEIPNVLATRRFAIGSKYVLIKSEKEIIASGWYLSDYKAFHVEEINRHICLNKNYFVLYDFYTNINYRNRGYYTTLLKYIQKHLMGNTLIIYALKENKASCKAIEKSGFSLIGKFNSRSLDFYHIMNRYSVKVRYKMYTYFSDINRIAKKVIRKVHF